MSIRKPVGVEHISNKCNFSLWAPLAQEVWLELVEPDHARFRLNRADHGYWSLSLDNVGPGTRYFYNIDESGPRPDPASRSQPSGVHGPSEVVGMDQYRWNDEDWNNIPLDTYIVYELHTGTFTPGGTFEDIITKLDYLARLGVTAIELMPVSSFPGGRNWGYDGVYPFAVQDSYGGPYGLMKLVDHCHSAGIAVILDVVYNHLGPEGNYLEQYGPYFTSRYQTPWGKAVNFDDRYSDGFRNYVVQNALMWFRDFHIDALRLDAVHAIYDFSAMHIMQELAEETAMISRKKDRPFYLIAESDLNNTRYINPVTQGGYGLDAQWSDDFHHALHALVTGEKNGYYADFGHVADLAKAFSSAFVYDGIYSDYRKRTFGSSTAQNPASQFVVCSQNHDQVGNRRLGDRMSTLVDFETLKLVAGTVITSPFLPLIFMGEEYGETNPFLYFVSHNDARLNRLVKEGRQKEFSGFYNEEGGQVPDPADEETFRKSVLSLDINHNDKAPALFGFYRALISLRKNQPVFSRADKQSISTAVAGKLLTVHRREQANSLWCFYNFGKEPSATAISQREQSSLVKKIDSSSQEWKGPGTTTPETVSPGEKITINSNSIVIYSTS